jgi:hypothetical protein
VRLQPDKITPNEYARRRNCVGSARVRARIVPFCTRITGRTTLIANEDAPYATPRGSRLSAGGEQSAQRRVVAGDEEAPFGVPISAIKRAARPERRNQAQCQRVCHIARLSCAYLRRAIHWEPAALLGALG